MVVRGKGGGQKREKQGRHEGLINSPLLSLSSASNFPLPSAHRVKQACARHAEECGKGGERGEREEKKAPSSYRYWQAEQEEGVGSIEAGIAQHVRVNGRHSNRHVPKRNIAHRNILRKEEGCSASCPPLSNNSKLQSMRMLTHKGILIWSRQVDNARRARFFAVSFARTALAAPSTTA